MVLVFFVSVQRVLAEEREKVEEAEAEKRRLNRPGPDVGPASGPARLASEYRHYLP